MCLSNGRTEQGHSFLLKVDLDLLRHSFPLVGVDLQSFAVAVVLDGVEVDFEIKRRLPLHIMGLVLRAPGAAAVRTGAACLCGGGWADRNFFATRYQEVILCIETYLDEKVKDLPLALNWETGFRILRGKSVSSWLADSSA